ncbi:hypothetical protein B0J14DRAFT_618507 [Halenospora varia]|nr:hypothetical protein B0J14DRAFT_618507 [Halenospora varia]
MPETFTWAASGLKQNEFLALGNLLSLRNGGQIEPASFVNDLLDNEPEECWETATIDTSIPTQIANSGFASEDDLVFRSLGSLLSEMSSNNAMVSYQQHQIEHDYLPDLRSSFKDYDAESSSSDIYDPQFQPTLAFAKLERLARMVYDLRVSEITTPKSKKLWKSICLFARLRLAFHKFKDAAETLPSFAKVRIVPLPRDISWNRRQDNPLSLKQVFELLKLPLDLTTTKLVIDQRWSLGRVDKEFTKHQKDRLNVHAEVQMLVHLSNESLWDSSVFPYLGCSKLSCFMCAHLLQLHGRFASRGSHGRVFKPWTVPEVSILGHNQADRIVKTMAKLQNAVKKELKSRIKKRMSVEKTSVVGGSSPPHLIFFRKRLFPPRDASCKPFLSRCVRIAFSP